MRAQASVCENVVIGVLVVLCELHVTRVVVVDAVVGLTLGLIAHVVVVVFVVAILQRIFCIWRKTLHKFPEARESRKLQETPFEQDPFAFNMQFHTHS